jgi:hypothetical protein
MQKLAKSKNRNMRPPSAKLPQLLSVATLQGGVIV